MIHKCLTHPYGSIVVTRMGTTMPKLEILESHDVGAPS
jgi:hypothetical protein